jgi:Sensors of blue-light using FAD
MNLCRLVYYSQRNRSVALDVKAMIAGAQRSNARDNLTGMLHFDGNAFIQVLEGGRAEVSATYHRIAADPRHSNLIIISCTEVRERLFPGWSMGLHESNAEKVRDTYMRYFASTKIDPRQVNVDSLLDVLQDLAAEFA